MDKDGFFLWLCRSGYSELTAELYVALVGGMIAKGSTPNTPIKQVLSPFSPSTHANRRISWKLWCRWTQAESAGKEVDHIDGDGRNNRRNNLRLVSHPEQMENLPARTSSGHRNVYWNSNRWMVKVCKGGVQHYGGRFEHLPEAVESARALRKELFTHAEEGRAQCAPGVGRPRKDLE